MSDAESLAVSSDDPALAFKAYVTAAGLAEEAVREALSQDHDEDDDEAGIFRIELLSEQAPTTQALIQSHRDTHHGDGNAGTHPRLFLVFDAADVAERGVLLVSLDEYHGFDDGVRLQPKDASNLVASLAVSNEDWYTVRQHVPDAKTGRAPVEWFALYDAVPRDEKRQGGDLFKEALLRMNRGVQDVGLGHDAAEEGDTEELPRYYTGVRAAGRTLDDIIEGHASVAEERRLDPARFAVIDGEYTRGRGALLVQLWPGRASFRCGGEGAGELLRWVFVGVMGWEEGRSFAAQR